MRHLTLIRLSTGEQGTFGVMLDGDEFLGQTLELPWKGNARDVSCIPAGTYDLFWREHSSNGSVYELLGVRDRSAVQIHSLNLPRETQGCIGLGSSLGVIAGAPAILDSRKAVRALVERTQRLPLRLTITWQIDPETGVDTDA